MATWEDGPEYAPVARPDLFTAPVAVSPLEPAPPIPVPSPDAPAHEPMFDQRVAVRPLNEHIPDLGPQRDPQEPYAVAAAAMTSIDSAWGSVIHYHVQPGETPAGVTPAGPPPYDPRAPILVTGAALSPMATAWPGPDGQPPESLPSGPVAQERPSPSFGAVFNAITAPTFITLLLGGLAMAVPLFGWLSPLMFILAFLTSGRIGYRRPWVRLAFLVGSGALGTTVLVGLLFSSSGGLAYFEVVQAVSTATCWLVLIALLGIVWQALGAGEQPEPRAGR